MLKNSLAIIHFSSSDDRLATAQPLLSYCLAIIIAFVFPVLTIAQQLLSYRLATA
jgi:hypothetical protein